MTDETQNPAIQRYWRSYLQSLPGESEKPPDEYQVWSFGNTPQMADELGELVRRGIKTATASLCWTFEQGMEPHPEIGGYSITLDGCGRPMCIIQTTGLSVHAFDEVGEEHAYLEGEGDRTLRHWREVHWDFFSDECKTLGREPHEKMPVLCERFKLVYS